MRIYILKALGACLYMKHWFHGLAKRLEKHMKRQRIMSGFCKWWTDYVINPSCAKSLACSLLCWCYLLSDYIIHNLVSNMNKYCSVFSCESFEQWSVSLPKSLSHKWMDALRLWWLCQHHVHTCHVCSHTQKHVCPHTHSFSSGNYKLMYWLTDFNIWSRLY